VVVGSTPAGGANNSMTYSCFLGTIEQIV
jgi:hypothetical protein